MGNMKNQLLKIQEFKSADNTRLLYSRNNVALYLSEELSGYYFVMFDLSTGGEHTTFTPTIDAPAVSRAIEHLRGFIDNVGAGKLRHADMFDIRQQLRGNDTPKLQTVKSNYKAKQTAQFSQAIDSDIECAKFIKRLGKRGDYYAAMRDIARDSLRAANQSGNRFQKAAAMRSINYFSRKAYQIGSVK